MFRKLILITVFLGMVGTFETVLAKSLEEVLKEKGVITEEDYKEIISGKDLTLTSPHRRRNNLNMIRLHTNLAVVSNLPHRMGKIHSLSVARCNLNMITWTVTRGRTAANSK